MLKKEEHKCPQCHFYTKSKEEMNYRTVRKHVPSSSKQSTVFFVNKSFQNASLSNNIGEKITELSNGNLMVRSAT